MVWTPKYNAVQEEGLIDNILTIVTRDFKEALDVFYPIEAALPDTNPRYLRDFQERILGQISRLVFPSLAIAPTRCASVPSDAADRLREAIQVISWIGVTDDSAANVTTRAMRYAATYEQVLRSARKSDYFRNMSIQRFGFVLDEVERDYGPIGLEDSIFFRAVRVSTNLVIHEA